MADLPQRWCSPYRWRNWGTKICYLRAHFGSTKSFGHHPYSRLGTMSRNWVREQGRPSSSFHGGRQQTKPQITNAKEKNGDEREPGPGFRPEASPRGWRLPWSWVGEEGHRGAGGRTARSGPRHKSMLGEPEGPVWLSIVRSKRFSSVRAAGWGQGDWILFPNCWRVCGFFFLKFFKLKYSRQWSA